MDIKNLIEVLSAALTPVIAVVTTYIMYQQWRTNKGRLNHELYERGSRYLKQLRLFMRT